MNTTTFTPTSGALLGPPGGRAVLDDAHVGDIHGALGTLRQHGAKPRFRRHRLLALLAIMGPGLIVMVGDNDAGGVATYAQAGQNYRLTLLWALVLLVPVLILNQEMVVRLGAVTGVGHARLIIERFGKFWGAFSVGDLFILNFLTIVTEFIGVSLALGYFGVSEYLAVPVAAGALIAIAATGSFRRWERFMFVFVVTNFIAIPLAIISHPHLQPIVHGALTVRQRRRGRERAVAHARPGRPRPVRDCPAERRGHRRRRGHAGQLVRVRRRVPPPAFAASRRRAGSLFHGSYAATVVLAAIVLIPDAPLGTITTAVQALAGVLLPSATVFLLLLCNERAVLGPWTNPGWLNALASLIVGVLVVLSAILTATTLFPHIDIATTTEVLFAALVLVLAVAGAYVAHGRRTAPVALDVPAGGRRPSDPDRMPAVRERWTMPPLELLERPVWSRTRTIGMYTLRGYLLVAVLMLVVKAVEIGLGH